MNENFGSNYMDNEINEDFFKNASQPSLTFEPVFEEVENPSVNTVHTPKAEPEDNLLSPEEKKLVDDFVEKIDLNNSNSILQYFRNF